MLAMVFPEDDRPLPNFREVAWVETDDRSLSSLISGGPRDPNDKVEIEEYEPQRVSIRTQMNRAGLVVLADVDYPGWHLTIDGKPATIVRTNRAMPGRSFQAERIAWFTTMIPTRFESGSPVRSPD